jgi:hypothetical protein
MGTLGQQKAQQWQTHTDKNNLTVGNLARGGSDHELGEGVVRIIGHNHFLLRLV